MTIRPAGITRDPHADHDRETIAAFAAGDAFASELARAEVLVRDCPACAALAIDLRAIATATRTLQRAVPAPRDFRLTTATAARLRGGPLQHFLRWIGIAGLNPRPFAAAFTTLGIAGLLIAVVPFASLLGSTGSAAVRETAAQSTGAIDARGSNGGTKVVDASGGTDASGGADGQAIQPSQAPGVLPAPADGAVASGGPAATVIPEYGIISPAPTKAPEVAPSPAPRTATAVERALPLLGLSVGFIAIGLALFAASRRSARRR